MPEKNENYSYVLRIPNQDSMKFLRYKKFNLERDILTIAQTIFNVEREIREGKKIDKVEITIDRETFRWIDYKKLQSELEDLFIQVLFKKIRIEIKYADLMKYRKHKKFVFDDIKNLCLFSGGADSFSGIFNTKNQLKDVVGVFVAHSDQTGVINITNKLIKNVLKPRGIKCETIYAPRMGSGDYSQLRGFLYFLSASIYSNLLNSSNLIITECGSTMYQPRFAPYDSVTMTTHPIILEKVKKIIEIMLNKKVNIIIPFENSTKSEVISNSTFKEYLKNTHSCITERFRRHDGTCYGCVIRKIGFICAGVEDVIYAKDPFLDKSANNDNLLSLMRFSYDILTDYENMPFFSKENAFLFDKFDLFKRFSLDTFSALYLINKMKGKLGDKIKSLYDQAISDIGEEALIKRIEEIRINKNKPDFEKKV